MIQESSSQTFGRFLSFCFGLVEADFLSSRFEFVDVITISEFPTFLFSSFKSYFRMQRPFHVDTLKSRSNEINENFAGSIFLLCYLADIEFWLRVFTDKNIHGLLSIYHVFLTSYFYLYFVLHAVYIRSDKLELIVLRERFLSVASIFHF